MTTLSPAATAVLDAFTDSDTIHGLHLMTPRLAAALRAVVQELKYFGITEKNILAMTAELESQ